MKRAQTYQVPKGKTKNGFTKKESQPLATAPRPLPEGELVISFYDSAKELLSTETFALTKENQWETLSFATKAEEKGYVSAYIQGKSAKPVSFDNFQIKTRATYTAKLYQENHYYPFGMNMKGLESSDKQTQQNKKEHKFQFNAQTEREESFGLFWDETPFRNYDMQLGRLWGVDKLAELIPMVSPSQYAYNNPILFNDPSGLIGETFVANSPARTTKSYDPNANSAYIFQKWAEAGGGGSEIDKQRKVASAYPGIFISTQARRVSSDKTSTYFNADDRYEGIEGEWVRRVNKMLDNIAATSHGRAYLTELGKSGFEYVIIMLDDPHNKIGNIAVPTDPVKAGTLGEGSGGNIYINPDKLHGSPDESHPVGFGAIAWERPVWVALAHELIGHGLQMARGTWEPNREVLQSGINMPWTELDASHRENIIRAQSKSMRNRMRLSYGAKVGDSTQRVPLFPVQLGISGGDTINSPSDYRKLFKISKP